jgi:hypothetical protein
MTTTKTTNKTALLYALENLPEAPAEVREKWQKMVEQLDKKNAAPAKMTAKQEANEGVKGEILSFLSDNAGEGYTCSDLLKTIPSCEGKSNQYVSALMSQLFKSGAVEKYTDKRRTYFRIPAEVEG